MSWKPLLSIACMAAAGVSESEAAVVRFVPPAEEVVAGSEVVLDLVIEYEAGESASLFGFGVRVEVLGAGLANFRTLSLPDALNHNGPNGAGAFTDLSPGILGVKGTVDILNPPVMPYAGSLLAQYTFEFAEVGPVTFTPRLFNTLGPTEEIFVAGNGQVLDDRLRFESTTIAAIPEPGAAMLALGAAVLFLIRRRAARS